MTIIIITFFGTLIILLFMIFFQAWRVRAGLATAQDLSVPERFHDKALVHVKTNLRKSAQRAVHKMIIGALKGWVIFAHIVSKKFKEIFPKTSAFFSTKPKAPKEGETGSFFLHSIAEYKQKVKKFKQKIKENDKKES